MDKKKILSFIYNNNKFIKLIIGCISLASLIFCIGVAIYYHHDGDLLLISKYSAVVCNHDGTPFLSETCEKCGDSVFLTGKLYNVDTQDYDNFIDVFGYTADSFPKYCRLMLQWVKLSTWLSTSLIICILSTITLGLFFGFVKYLKLRYNFTEIKSGSILKDKKEKIKE